MDSAKSYDIAKRDVWEAYQLVKANRGAAGVDGKAFALTEMCAVLEVSVSGYRAWKRGGTPGRKRLRMRRCWS